MSQKVLIADDDPVTRLMLKTLLQEWNYEVFEATDGNEARQILQNDEAPELCILDWMMPGTDGIGICRDIRKKQPERIIYFLLLTVKTHRSDIISGLKAGADDFLSKPFDYEELQVRLQVGRRTLDLQLKLAEKAGELQKALTQVKKLKDLLPICACCKKIRDDKGYWNQVETYVSKHLDVEFSHGLCPQCCEKMYPEYSDETNSSS